MKDLLKTRFMMPWGLILVLCACSPGLDKKAIYGEYSLLSDGVQHVLIIIPDGTYIQKEIVDGNVVSIKKKQWNDYFPDSSEIRYDLIDFKFPSQKETSDWPALIEKRWTRLNLCYFNEEMDTECYVKRKS